MINLQEYGFIESCFGKPIQIIIHDLEYPRYVIQATVLANPDGQADAFLEAMKELGLTA